MSDLVKTNQYRVYYKFPNQPAVRWDYSAPSFSQLMRNLQYSEGVNRDKVEFLFIHQYHPDGKVTEVLSIDKQKVTVGTTATPNRHKPSELPPFSTAYDESVLTNVQKLLTKAANVLIKPSVKAPVRALIHGYDFTAHPAKSV